MSKNTSKYKLVKRSTLNFTLNENGVPKEYRINAGDEVSLPDDNEYVKSLVGFKHIEKVQSKKTTKTEE